MTAAADLLRKTPCEGNVSLEFTISSGEFVPFHRLANDECWTVSAGDGVQLHVIHRDGAYDIRTLTPGAVTVVEANSLRAARVVPGGESARCLRRSTAGYDAGIVEVPSAAEILRQHPVYAALVHRLAK